MGSDTANWTYRHSLCSDALPQPLRVLLTGAGSPATWGTKFSLDAEFIEVDVREGWDYRVRYPSVDFITDLRDICLRENVDVVVPQVEDELLWLAKYRDVLPCPVLVSDYSAIIKAQKRNLMGLGLGGKFAIVKSDKRGDHKEVMSAIGQIGLPCVIKSLDKSGGNGVRFVKESLDYSNFSGKPDGWISLSDLIWMLGDKSYELLITEYFPGKEYSVDVLAHKGEAVCVVPRTRDVIRSGITFEGETVENGEIADLCDFLVRKLGLDGAVGFQFKEDAEGYIYLLECNPRVQGTMVHSTLAGANIIRGAVQMVLDRREGLILANAESYFRPKWGVKVRRYWGCSVQS